MRLSIITPVLNARSQIQACLDCAREQGVADYEHIIVDGGSADGTLAIVEQAMLTDPRIRLIRGPDRGQVDAMNKGVRAASGDAISLLNVDDTYAPGALQEMSDALGRQRSPALVAGDCQVLNEAGDVLYWNRPTDLRLEALLLGWGVAQFPCNPSAYIYHRAVHDLVGEYRLEAGDAQDLDFLLRCAGKIRMRYVPRHWGNFVLAPGSKTYENFRLGRDPKVAVYALHAASVTRAQRRTMHRIGLVHRLRGAVLRRLKLPRTSDRHLSK